MPEPTTAAEWGARVKTLHAEMRTAEERWMAALLAEFPIKAGDVVQARGKPAKVVRVEATRYGIVQPVVVYRVKSGQWGTGEHRVYPHQVQAS